MTTDKRDPLYHAERAVRFARYAFIAACIAFAAILVRIGLELFG